MKLFSISSIVFILLWLSACSKEEATEQERISARFADSLGVEISSLQWWRTTVKLKINVTTDQPVKLMLMSSGGGVTYLYDYKEVPRSATVTMTAPQGQGSTFNLAYFYKEKLYNQEVILTGKAEEVITLNITSSKRAPARAAALRHAPPSSLCGESLTGGIHYYQFTDSQLKSYFSMMELSKSNEDAKVIGLNTHYELLSNGPFYITWVNGYEADQRSRILGYYYHSPHTWKDIVYVDLAETHKWDYIDGMAKVQYQLSISDVVDGHSFVPGVWYDANFDLNDYYGSTFSRNMDRLGDNAYNSQEVYKRYGKSISALRGISFEIDVPEGMRVGFYLRSDEEPYPEQWSLLEGQGIRPYVDKQEDFMGTCFCVENMNIVGNGGGLHRSFIKDYKDVYWMGMEDLVHGGDHDCNDVIFGVESDLLIQMPTIVSPELTEPEVTVEDLLEEATPFPWTLAYEDVNRDPDFDFNDAVIKVEPDYENEQCCVTVMAAGSDVRMYLHYDGPDGDVNLGEIHELLNGKSGSYINTKSLVAGTPFVQVDCVPWPKDYTMANDAKRFYIEIQRGSCADCTDVITLANEPGKMPEALLVAGEWQWPLEGEHIRNAYDEFPKWARDESRMRFWEWYKTPEANTYVTY